LNEVHEPVSIQELVDLAAASRLVPVLEVQIDQGQPQRIDLTKDRRGHGRRSPDL